MPLDHRQWLQYYHNKDNIYYALGGNEFVKQCPLCKSMYTEKSGCNFVTCANLRCRTQFCWECNAPIKDISHFAGSKCHVGYEDIIRSLFYIKAAIDIKAFAVALAIPLALFSFMCGLPIFIVFAFPSLLVQRIYKSATRNTDSLTLPEWGLLLFKMISLWIVALPVGLLMGINSIFTGFVMFILYIILEEYDKILPMAQRFGIGPFKQMLKDGKEAKKRREKHLDEHKS
uniref:IBR domain-containing protein n=1 Tax=Heterorhabditis bacteriophora TaxID=37862 RepID=A0A1I7WNJ2_HETBA